MHRVVRLTFADDQSLDLAVARNRGEADQNLSLYSADLIIAYVHFDGLTDARYFESLKLVTPRILLLAESEENLEPLIREGFDKILRKPFHSDELRQMVEGMLAERVAHERVQSQPKDSAKSEPVEVIKKRSKNEVAGRTKDQLEVDFSPKDKNNSIQFLPIELSESLPDEPISFPRTTQSIIDDGQPKLTMDLSFLQKSVEKSAVAEPVLHTKVRSGVRNVPLSDSLSMPSSQSSPDFSAASAGGLSRREVEKIVEDSVAAAVGRAVRQALSETLPDLRQTLIAEVTQKAVHQLSEEMFALKKTLREQMIADLREVSAQWLKRETPNFAKDVIREEIRKVIEQM
jgi:CheY-like chemotaxis protein